MSTEPTKDHDNLPNLESQPHQSLDEMIQSIKDHLERITDPFEFVLWSPPQDPDKPPLPYLSGFTTKVYRHQNSGKEPRPSLSEEYLKTVPQSESIVANAPIEPSPETCTDIETAQLTIATPLAIGEERGAQIVACRVTCPWQKDGGGAETSKVFEAAAKIYDPLYYSPFKRRWFYSTSPQDCLYVAGEDYRTEALAYEFLCESGQNGSFAPEYYGSWTFQLPITIKGKPLMRKVRLILMELLDGTSIQDMRAQNNPDRSMGMDSIPYPEEYRLEVLARAMDSYVRQRKTGLIHWHFTARNVILVDKNDPQAERVCGLPMPRIVLIDYHFARRIHVPEEEVTGLPDNPIDILSRKCLWKNFAGWVPNEWFHGNLNDQREWFLRRFAGDDQRKLYSPLREVVEEHLWADK